MPDYVKFDGVAVADIVKIDGVSKSGIAKVCGATTPAAGATTATRWVVALDDGFVSYAPNSDLTDWTTYDHLTGTGHPPAFDICAGKNASGETIYICSLDTPTKELLVSGNDVTSTNDWTVIDLGTGDQDQFRIIWFDDGSTSGVWLAVGRQASAGVSRSTDGGANWSNVALSGLTGHDTTRGIQAMAYGNGVVMLAQDERIYTSTDDGASFSVSTPFSTDTPTSARCLTYTNNSWVLVCGRSGELRVRSCADSDLTDWSAEYTPTTLTRNPSNTFEDTVVIASYNGRVCHITTKDRYLSYFDVDGKTVSNMNHVTLDMNSASNRAEDIDTDGTTWLIAAREGDIWKSVDSGESWSKVLDDLGGSSDHAMAICSDVLTVV
tara:strand:+ start:84 stop:1223 length:1140 start_codon:yes stop_codon:yes gene_type:complete